MWAGVSTPEAISFFALLARSIWPRLAPTPTLLVCSETPSAAFFILSKNPIGDPPFLSLFTPCATLPPSDSGGKAPPIPSERHDAQRDHTHPPLRCPRPPPL